jgi:cytochrome c-type biogenesis protein CcmH
MRNFLLLACVALFTMFTLRTLVTPYARAAEPAATESALDKRVTALAQDLRCLVCQNQTIADSQAPLAIDLKNQVREKIAQGLSDDQIIDYMVQRYGDFVLYRPPVKAATLGLWFGPAALLILGLVVLFRYLARRRREQSADAPLTDAEHRRAQTLLGTTDRTTDKESR